MPAISEPYIDSSLSNSDSELDEDMRIRLRAPSQFKSG